MIRGLLACAVLLETLGPAPAAAATIRLIDDQHSVRGSPAEEAFRVAAAFWARTLAGPAVVTFRVRFSRPSSMGLGLTDARYQQVSVARWERAWRRTRNGRRLDRTAVLPPLHAGAVSGMTLGMGPAGNDMRTSVLLTPGHRAARELLLPTALIRALRLPLAHPGRADAVITINSQWAFDFDPTDGLKPSGVDLVAVILHEMGHALGFGSGVDAMDDVARPRGLSRGQGRGDLNDTVYLSALDMFRYAGPGRLDWRPGTMTYFSIDGGRTALLGARFSTGSANGDGNQAGHWWQAKGGGCTLTFGIMDAGRCGGGAGAVTRADLHALAAIGWNLAPDALRPSSRSTADLVRAYRASPVRPAEQPDRVVRADG